MTYLIRQRNVYIYIYSTNIRIKIKDFPFQGNRKFNRMNLLVKNKRLIDKIVVVLTKLKL